MDPIATSAAVPLGAGERIVIVCRRPGFRRAGISHPARAEYPADRFTREQMEALRSEPVLEVMVVPGAVVGLGFAPGGRHASTDAAALDRAEHAGKAMASGSADAGIEAQAARDLAAQAAPSASTPMQHPDAPAQRAVTSQMIDSAAETQEANDRPIAEAVGEARNAVAAVDPVLAVDLDAGTAPAVPGAPSARGRRSN